MDMVLRQIRAALAAGDPIEDLLDDLDRRLGETGGAGDPAGEVTRLTEQVQTVSAERDAVRALADAALDRYRTARAETLGVTADLLSGASVEAIDEAADRARRLVGDIETRVRERIAALSVPAGDSGRTPPDLSALPPSEKIKLGLAAGSR